MLWVIFIILVVVWILGIVSATTLGGFLHIILVAAIIIMIIKIIKG